MSTKRPSGHAEAIPLACVPGAIPTAERPAHFRLLTQLFATAARERRQLSDGYAFRFAADAFDDLERWITNERRCCPFLHFALELSPDDGPVWVRLTGPAGTHELLDADLPPVAGGGHTSPDQARSPGAAPRPAAD